MCISNNVGRRRIDNAITTSTATSIDDVESDLFNMFQINGASFLQKPAALPIVSSSSSLMTNASAEWDSSTAISASYFPSRPLGEIPLIHHNHDPNLKQLKSQQQPQPQQGKEQPQQQQGKEQPQPQQGEEQQQQHDSNDSFESNSLQARHGRHNHHHHHTRHHERHVIQHNYHDHSDDVNTDSLNSKPPKARGGVTTPFPTKLHQALSRIEDDGLADIISWQPHGRSFVVHKPNVFTTQILPQYFQLGKIASFQRQLNLYGFSRLTSGIDRGGYYHELFLRHREFLARKIQRMKVKGTGSRPASNPEAEPNFYSMKWVTECLSSMTTTTKEEKEGEKEQQEDQQKKDISNKLSSPVPQLVPVVSAAAAVATTAAAASVVVPEAKMIISTTTTSSTVSNPSWNFIMPKQEEEKVVSQQEDDVDVVMFEGKQFHYLDLSIFQNGATASSFDDETDTKKKKKVATEAVPAPTMPMSRLSPHDRVPSTTISFPNSSFQKRFNTSWTVQQQRHYQVVVSDDSSSDNSVEEDEYDDSNKTHFPTLPPAGAAAFAAAATATTSTACPTSDSDEAIMTEGDKDFFTKIDIPSDLYHQQVNHVELEDDAAFGYLLEKAIE